MTETYTYIHIYIHSYTHTHIHTYLYIHIYIHIHIYTFTNIHTCILSIYQYISNKMHVTQFIYIWKLPTCFGWYFNPSSEAHTTVSKASSICHTVTAICRSRGRVGTSLSVLWVAYATHSTLNPVPTLPR
jgi:hypothetical protein